MAKKQTPETPAPEKGPERPKVPLTAENLADPKIRRKLGIYDADA